MKTPLQAAVIGAGPYGLSIAAHLQASGISFQIFGPPMQTWRDHMPKGMLLKSDGFASNLSDPAGSLTLQHYCADRKIDYGHTRVPVKLETFVDYGMAFQQKFLPNLDPRQVTHLEQSANGFVLTLEDGETVEARRVILAVGITHYAHLPAEFGSLPPDYVSHASAHSDLEKFRGKSIAVIGSGASAVDIAALLKEAGADVTIIARRKAIAFHNPPPKGERSLWQKLRRPSSGLGSAWPSRFFTDAPALFRFFPRDMRVRIVREYLGPAPGWPMRARVEGKIPMHLGSRNIRPTLNGSQVHVHFEGRGGEQNDLAFDHVIAATGYKANLDRLFFLSDGIRKQLRVIADAPELSTAFESSIPGLYFVGISAAHTFGPMMRFAFGSAYTAERVSRHVVRQAEATR